jgi:hypothetical protein
MFMSSLWALRWSGISGILGAVLFIAGDLLYNHVPGSNQNPAQKMSRLPESRLLNAGTLGLVGCWLYCLGSAHLYLAFQPAGASFDWLVFILFAAVMVCYGISHTAYFAIASGAQTAARLGAEAETGGRLGNAFFKRLVTITYAPVLLASLMMIYGVLSGRSFYPVWMVIFLPVVIYLLKTPVVRILRGHLREVINDAYDNISLLVFFAVSTIVLWNAAIG